jgi:predicted DNA-binding transcriptional regulator AlpA
MTQDSVDIGETYLETPDAATYTNIAVSTLCKWRCNMSGPPFLRAGSRKVLYRRSDLDKWLASQLCRSTAGPLVA